MPKVQVPLAQVSVAPGKSQVEPQALQLLVLVSATSHPLLATKSQSPNPPLQVPRVQLPVAQDSPALARSHAVLQAPQCVSVLSWVSQPLAALPSQFPYPALQVPSKHVPVLQLAVAFGRLQETPQAPQCAVVSVDCSQPLAAMPSQLPKFALQLPSVQLPVGQLAAALARLHGVLHAPQWASV